jgi:hypothetical protein
MSLRSLIFSSHPETANPLLQALRELDLAVEHSTEIFAAVRELTSRSFDLIVADLDEGPEAEFLLKTAGQLRINNRAFVLVVGNYGMTPPGPHTAADLLLSKPLIPEQIKYSLLGCDHFLVAYMRGGVAKVDSSKLKKVDPQEKPQISPLLAAMKAHVPAHRQ